MYIVIIQKVAYLRILGIIFAFPLACVIIRYILRPFIWSWLRRNIVDNESVTDYITNYLCFIALSIEVFIILYVNEIVKHVTVILFLDTFVLIGLLAMAVHNWKGTSTSS